MTADCLFFAAVGAAYGGLAGWWARGRRERRDESRERTAELGAMLLEHAVNEDPETWRLERLAYDEIYDAHRAHRP